MKLTNFEIQREWQYRFDERMAILLGHEKPTQDQDALAREEADKWKARYDREQSGELNL